MWGLFIICPGSLVVSMAVKVDLSLLEDPSMLKLSGLVLFVSLEENGGRNAMLDRKHVSLPR
jgi:hypothetical protein